MKSVIWIDLKCLIACCGCDLNLCIWCLLQLEIEVMQIVWENDMLNCLMF
jgi:hypothetical protein